MSGARLAALSCVAAFVAGCAGTGAPSVAAPARTAPAPRRFRLAIELAPRADAVRLRLPLPHGDARQEVSLLAWELGAPGSYAVREAEGGERVLEVEAPGGGSLPPVRLLTEVRRTRDRSWRALPRRLVAGRALEAQAWVEHAQRVGAEARVVHGVELDLERSEAQRCAWPELREEAGWVPVDPRSGRIGLDPARVRLGVAAPDLELRGGEHLDPPLRLSLLEVGAGCGS